MPNESLAMTLPPPPLLQGQWVRHDHVQTVCAAAARDHARTSSDTLNNVDSTRRSWTGNVFLLCLAQIRAISIYV